jgi:hypothetical protein
MQFQDLKDEKLCANLMKVYYTVCVCVCVCVCVFARLLEVLMIYVMEEC